MNSQSHKSPIWGIIPPHILEAIAKSGTAEEREIALRALATDTTLRNIRLTRHLTRPATRAIPTLATVTAPHKNRLIYSAKNTENLPGTLVRSEGQGPTGDAAVDEAYDGFGFTFELFWNIFKRNSIDNAGMDLIGTVHFGQNYANAFWDGAQMAFGDGDGPGGFFNRFTIAIDVMGHELTHGVTAHLANLVYHDQSGALNEHISDVFGSMVKQYAHVPQQTASQADWLIGAGLFTSRVNGVALRSMKAPGTAYDDRVLGKDPQPDHMSKYDTRTSDNGGVHINSGIPNRAFYLLAVGLGGFAWAKAGQIWYATLCDPRLSSNAQFQDFANLTADNALKLFGQAEQQAVIDAWQKVGINVIPAVQAKISGNWILHYSWNAPSGKYSQANVTFNANGTFIAVEKSGQVMNGKWVQQDGTIMLAFDAGLAKYAGNLDGNVGTGAMTTFAGSNGCFYLTKEGTVGLVPELTTVGQTELIDVTGNPIREPELAAVGAQGLYFAKRA